MDWTQIIGLVAPALVGIIVQVAKKIMGLSGYAALGLVFVVGGITAVLGIGPDQGVGYVSTTVNAGFVVGVATFLYSLVKNLTSKP